MQLFYYLAWLLQNFQMRHRARNMYTTSPEAFTPAYDNHPVPMTPGSPPGLRRTPYTDPQAPGQLRRVDVDGLPDGAAGFDDPRASGWPTGRDEEWGRPLSPPVPRVASPVHPRPAAPLPRLPPLLPHTHNPAYVHDVDDMDPVPVIPPWERTVLGRPGGHGRLPPFKG